MMLREPDVEFVNMKFSVIVPVYNVEQYLEECIDSVLSQSYSNFEIILVDDGSTDGSGMLCDIYAQNNENVFVIHSANNGPMAARLQGIEAASGDVLTFLDADDCLRNDALEILAGSFNSHNCDMVLYNAGLSQKFPAIECVCSLGIGTVFEYDNFVELYRAIIDGRIPNALCLKAVKKDCVKVDIDLMGLTHVRQGEDLLQSVLYMHNCKKIVYLNEGLYYYRSRPNSATHSFNSGRKESIKIVHKILSDCFKVWELEELKFAHNTRMVKSWLAVLNLLMCSRKTIAFQDYNIELKAMAEDAYFRNAYDSADKNQLSLGQRLCAAFLYRKNYIALNALYYLKELKKALK